jgi:hypothetical protein
MLGAQQQFVVGKFATKSSQLQAAMQLLTVQTNKDK